MLLHTCTVNCKSVGREEAARDSRAGPWVFWGGGGGGHEPRNESA